MVALSERSRNLAQQVLFKRRSDLDEDMKRYLAGCHTPSPKFNAVSKANADRLGEELAEIDKALEELRTC